MGLKGNTQPRIQAQSEILQTKLLGDIFCWKDSGGKRCEQQPVFYNFLYCSHSKLNMKLSPGYCSVSQRKILLHFGTRFNLKYIYVYKYILCIFSQMFKSYVVSGWCMMYYSCKLEINGKQVFMTRYEAENQTTVYTGACERCKSETSFQNLLLNYF